MSTKEKEEVETEFFGADRPENEQSGNHIVTNGKEKTATLRKLLDTPADDLAST